jgi:autotransporter translocation and assembly factor TamB
VPAKVSGKWRWQVATNGQSSTFELTLNQMFQKIDGTLSVDGHAAKINEAKLTGANIRIDASSNAGNSTVHYAFSGRVVNNRIEGQVQVRNGGNEQQATWKAARTEAIEPAHAALKPPPPPPGSW